MLPLHSRDIFVEFFGAENGPKKGQLTPNKGSFPQQPTTNSFFQNIKFVIVMCC